VTFKEVKQSIALKQYHVNFLRTLIHIFLRFSLFFVFFTVVSQGIKGQKINFTDSIIKYSQIDSSKTKFFIDEYIFESKADNDPKNLFVAYHFLTVFYYQHNDTLKVIENTNKLFSIAKENNLRIELLKAYHLKNNNLRMKYGLDDPRIVDNIFKGLKLAKEINSVVWECKFNQAIAEYYVVTDEYDQALLYYQENLAILLNIANSEEYKKFKIWGSNLENTYLSIAEIYTELKNIDSAKIYNKYAKTVLDTTTGGYKEMYEFSHKVNELEINLLENNITLAKKNFEDAVNLTPDYYKKSNNDFWKEYYSGMISYHEGKYKKAITHFETLDTFKIKTNERLGFFYDDLYKTLYKSYLKTNNLKKADYYFEKHLSSLKGQMDINNSVNSNFKKTEIDQYNAEVAALKKQKSRQWYILLATTSVAAFIICLLIARFRKQKTKSKKQLKVLLDQISKNETPIKPKVAPINIKDKEMKRIIEKLNELEDKNYYLRMDLTASSLAKKLKTNTTYLSKIINIHYQKNFTTYINDLRIDFVINRLKENNLFRRYTIQSLANEVGFKSKESFNTAFKKRTGVLPSALIKELTKQSN